MQVTETIRVRAEQQEIKRGIYRDFPTDYKDRFGNRYRVGFEMVRPGVMATVRTGTAKPRAMGCGFTWGTRMSTLIRAITLTRITYRTNRQLGFFDDHDELYWNVTGNHWSLPIDSVSARVTLPRWAAR